MGILINLLPDLKQAKLREQRRRQVAVGLSVLIWIICAGTILVMFLISAGQKVTINLHNDSIAKNRKLLEEVSGLPDALTAAQHLNSLSSLYTNRVLFTKFFNAYSEADPLDISLDSMVVNESNQLTVTGVSKTFASLAKLQRALELSNISIGTGANTTNQPYFTTIKLQTAVNTPGKGVVFTLNADVSTEVLRAK